MQRRHWASLRANHFEMHSSSCCLPRTNWEPQLWIQRQTVLDPGFRGGQVPYRLRQRLVCTESDRGTACVLERLPEALAGIVSRRIISREQRAREDQLHIDAIFNLALLFQRSNKHAEAAEYWRHYLANDGQSEWAARARRSLKFCEKQIHLSASAISRG